MKKIVNGIEIEMTAAEIAAKQAEEQNAITVKEAEEAAKTARENLKASAKAKLIAGQPLTEEEADTIVL